MGAIEQFEVYVLFDVKYKKIVTCLPEKVVHVDMISAITQQINLTVRHSYSFITRKTLFSWKLDYEHVGDVKKPLATIISECLKNHTQHQL